MTRYYTYDATIPHGPADLGAEADVRIVYTYTPGCPARIHYDEWGHPAEGPEIDIISVQEEVTTIAGKKRWFEVANPLDELVRDRVDEQAGLWSELVANAAESDIADRNDEDAMERAAETRREIRQTGDDG